MGMVGLELAQTRGFNLMRELNKLFNQKPDTLLRLSMLGGEGELTADHTQQHAFAMKYVSKLVQQEMGDGAASFWSQVHPDVKKAMAEQGLDQPQGRAFVRAGAQGQGVSITEFVLGPDHPADSLQVEPALSLNQKPAQTQVEPAKGQVDERGGLTLPPTEGHGAVISELRMRDGAFIRLYEDEHFELIDEKGTTIIEPDQLNSSKMGWFNWTMAKLTQNTAWFAVGSTVGSAVAAGAPALQAVHATSAGGAATSITGSVAQEAFGQAVGQDHLLAPLTAAVPDVGSVEKVAFVQKEDGSIWRLAFGWTPDRQLFYRDNGWYLYKKPDKQ